MKYSAKMDLIVIVMFFISLLVGLAIFSQYVDFEGMLDAKRIKWSKNPLDLYLPWLIVLLGIAMLLFVRIKENVTSLLKPLFFMFVLMGLSVVFALFVNIYIALLIAVVLYLIKIYWKNSYINNIIEMIVAGGCIALLTASMEALNIFNVLVASTALIAISILDFAYMHKLRLGEVAKVGLIVGPKKEEARRKEISDNYSFVGIGDMMGAMFFTNLVFKELMLKELLFSAFLKTLIIPAAATAGLLFATFKLAKPGKNYPVMPFITMGCFIGYGIIWLIGVV